MNTIFKEYIDKDYGDIKALRFEDIIVKELKANGMEVERQVWVDNRGDGRRGKIDLVAYFKGEKIGIEVDRKKPRKKSIFKLEQLECDKRFVIIRSPFKVIEI